jgi:hypothetical protein
VLDGGFSVRTPVDEPLKRREGLPVVPAVFVSPVMIRTCRRQSGMVSTGPAADAGLAVMPRVASAISAARTATPLERMAVVGMMISSW